MSRLIWEIHHERGVNLVEVVDAWMAGMDLQLCQDEIVLGDVEIVSRASEEQVQDMVHVQLLREQEERIREETGGVLEMVMDVGEAGRPWDSQLRRENALWVWRGRNQ